MEGLGQSVAAHGSGCRGRPGIGRGTSSGSSCSQHGGLHFVMCSATKGCDFSNSFAHAHPADEAVARTGVLHQKALVGRCLMDPSGTRVHRSGDESGLPRRLGVLAPQKIVQISSVRQLTATLTATLTGPGLPCELKGAVGATRLGIGLSAGTEEGVHAFRDHRAVVTFGVLWVKAHNGPRRRYGSQL